MSAVVLPGRPEAAAGAREFAREVRLTVTAASVLAEVVDDGPLGVPAVTSPESFAERGRGLAIVEALTRAWGSVGNGLWWFWLPLGGDPE